MIWLALGKNIFSIYPHSSTPSSVAVACALKKEQNHIQFDSLLSPVSTLQFASVFVISATRIIWILSASPLFPHRNGKYYQRHVSDWQCPCSKHYCYNKCDKMHFMVLANNNVKKGYMSYYYYHFEFVSIISLHCRAKEPRFCGQQCYPFRMNMNDILTQKKYALCDLHAFKCPSRFLMCAHTTEDWLCDAGNNDNCPISYLRITACFNITKLPGSKC